MLPLLLSLSACQPKALPPPVCADSPTVRTFGASRLKAYAEGCGEVSLDATLLGEGDLQLRFTRDAADDSLIHPVVSGDGTLRAVQLRGTWGLLGDAAPQWWRQGWQSWSWSGVVTLPEAWELDADGLPRVGGDGDALSVARETPWSSWGSGALIRPDGASLLLGTTEARISRVYVAADGDELATVWSFPEGLAVAGEVELEPLYLEFGPDAPALQASWADRAAARADAHPPNMQPPSGWASWYVFYADVSEADIRSQLAMLRSDDGELVQIDDGWQVAWGEWTANERFPSGLGALAADIRAAGFTPGLWMAPFYVSRTTTTWADHPDWWVRDLSGQQIRYTNAGSGDYAIVDTTHPDAAVWVRQQIADRVAEGFRYLKLDFLYAAAQVGLRHEPVTGVQAYHRGLALLREGAGDAWILACGAPLLPSLGFADSYRHGADIAFELSPDPDTAFLRSQGRQTAGRSFLHGRWWFNDPDQIIYRPPFDAAQARGALTLGVLAGGTWLLGDDLATLSPELLTLGTRADLRAFRGARATPRGSPPASGLDGSPLIERVQGDDLVPQTWDLSTGHVALINLSDLPAEVDSPGGTELITGGTAAAGPVTLAPGDGQIWLPADVEPAWPDLPPFAP